MCRSAPLFIFLFFFISCSDENKIPGDVLPPSKMEKVMWDMLRADEYVTSFIWKNDSAVNRFEESEKLYNEIFSIHNITKEKFEKSLSFYRNHTELMKNLIDSLSLQEHPYRKKESIQPIIDSAKSIH